MEYKLDTHIGDEIAVTVYFDYTPAQLMTWYEPAIDAAVELNGIYVDDNEAKEIGEILCDSCLDDLEQRCLEHMKKPPCRDDEY